MAISEDQLVSWSKPISTSEDDKCKRAVKEITECIRKKFGNSVTIFLQGSYQNNTNVRKDSDVDIVIRHDGFYYPDLQRLNEQQKIIYNERKVPGSYTFNELKDDVRLALISDFGAYVDPCNKCIKVKGNEYRINVDVIPCFVHRRYQDPFKTEAEGIQFYTDEGEEIISFPMQHYDNGTSKTNRTGRMYKRIVRILKMIRTKLIEEKKIQKELVSSFFIECLVFNVDDSKFVTGNYTQSLRNILITLLSDISNTNVERSYTEVNHLKWLFYEKRTKSQAQLFLSHCWNFADFQ